MTVATESRQQAYTGDEDVLDHPVPFPFLSSEDLVVSYTFAGATETLTEGEDYEVSGGDGEIGTVTFLWPPDNGSTITITRTLEFLQPTDLATQGNYSAKTHEDTFDRLTYLLIQLKDRVEALEAVLDALNLGTGSFLVRTLSFTTGANPEDIFPRTASLPVGFTAAAVRVGKPSNVTDPTDKMQTAPEVGAWSQSGTTLTVEHISGLAALTEYSIVLLIVAEE